MSSNPRQFYYNDALLDEFRLRFLGLRLRQALFQRRDQLVDISALRIDRRDTHVSDDPAAKSVAVET